MTMSNIQKGDLVMVVKSMPCCGSPDFIGAIRTVEGFYSGSSTCIRCGDIKDSNMADLGDGYMELELLKKIPPLEETDDIMETNKLLEPV